MRECFELITALTLGPCNADDCACGSGEGLVPGFLGELLQQVESFT
jgi:hypothetical protein